MVFEGLDGSGHSTQLALFSQNLAERQIPFIATAEPTEESPAGRCARKALLLHEHLPPDELQNLFVEDRKWHVAHVIEPALAAGITVLSDRYLHSTVAFGSIDLPIDLLVTWNSAFPLPDITFIFLARPEVCMERINKRGREQELFEHLDKLRRAETTYRILHTIYPNILFIDGERPVEVVASEVFAHINRLFPYR